MGGGRAFNEPPKCKRIRVHGGNYDGSDDELPDLPSDAYCSSDEDTLPPTPAAEESVVVNACQSPVPVESPCAGDHNGDFLKNVHKLVLSTGKMNAANFKSVFEKRFGYEVQLKRGQKLKGLLRAAENAGVVRLEQCDLVLWIHPPSTEVQPVLPSTPLPIRTLPAVSDKTGSNVPRMAPLQCYHGARCRKWACSADHPPGRAPLCRLAAACDDRQCQKYKLHPPSKNCAWGADCRVPKCPFKHPKPSSDRLTAGQHSVSHVRVPRSNPYDAAAPLNDHSSPPKYDLVARRHSVLPTASTRSYSSAAAASILGGRSDARTVLDGNKALHIFVDYSNIFYGAQNVAGISLTLPKLVKLVEAGRTARERVIFGSYTAAGKAWATKKIAECNSLNYTAHFGERPTGSGEQFVDDALIAQMQHTLLDVQTPSTLVLLTGDGNGNHGRASFVDTVVHYLDRGWKVEIWSWRSQTSAAWKKISANSNAGKFSLVYLDNYKWTFEDKSATPCRPAASRAAWTSRPRMCAQMNPPSSVRAVRNLNDYFGS